MSTAVQVVAAMPGVQAYLQQLCSRENSAGLKLHKALREQLERLAFYADECCHNFCKQ